MLYKAAQRYVAYYAVALLSQVQLVDMGKVELAYGWRMVLFFVVFGGILTAFAVGFGWFPTDRAEAWVSFAVIFVVIFAAIAAGIEIYYRASGRKWDDKLDWYRKTRERK